MSSDRYVLVVVGIGFLVVLILLIMLFKSTWRIAEPDEALIISGVSRGIRPARSPARACASRSSPAAGPWSCRACPRSAPSR